MTINSVLTIIQTIVDISLVWMLIYFVLKNLKNNIKMILIFKGVLIIIILKLLSDYVFKLTTLGYLLEYVKMWGPLALIIIFQPEIRNILEQLGRKQIITNHRTLTMDEREKVVYEITNAVDYLRKARMGGLIVIEREISLNQYIERSKNLYADISSELLISIFFPRNPLHDGGVIIQGDKIACAGAVFPISLNNKINKKLGTRHRAAIGLSEISDALVIIVSEETGIISLAINGRLTRNYDKDRLRTILLKIMEHREEKNVKTAGKKVKTWITGKINRK